MQHITGKGSAGVKALDANFEAEISKLVVFLALLNQSSGMNEFYLQIGFAARIMGLGTDACNLAFLIEQGFFMDFPNGFGAFIAPEVVGIAHAFAGTENDFIVLI